MWPKGLKKRRRREKGKHFLVADPADVAHLFDFQLGYRPSRGAKVAPVAKVAAPVSALKLPPPPLFNRGKEEKPLPPQRSAPKQAYTLNPKP